MCGFVVTVSNDHNDKLKIKKSLELISHRGPDDSNILSIDNMNFGFVRLSIQDLRIDAMQPMYSQNKRYLINFNGEIYNYKSLRDNLINRYKKSFRTSSDTEVLLESISEYGLEKTLDEIRGMFAFVLFDKLENKLILCRDHFGQKNLYYKFANNNSEYRLIIASEIKAFLPFNEKLIPDKNKISSQLFIDNIPSNGTLFKDIFEVKPGNISILSPLSLPNLKEIEYFNPTKLVEKNLYQEYKSMTKSSLLSEFDSLMKKSIELHSVSDAKLGLLFSTGIDSHLLLSYLDKLNIELFHASSKQQIGNSIADDIAEFHKCKLNKSDIDSQESLLINLPNLIWSYEQPNQIEGLMLSKACSLARSRGFKVLISGCCADELFGGYPYYNHFSWDVKLSQNIKNKKFFKKLSNIFGSMALADDSLAFHSLLSPTSLERVMNFLDYETGNFNTLSNFEKAINAYSFLDSQEQIFNNAYLLEEINTRMLRFLHRNDRFSMQESIELRVPYLDLDVVKFALNVPAQRRSGAPNIKHSKYSKPLIRNLLKKRTKKYPNNLQVKQGPVFNFLNDLDNISANYKYKNLEQILNLPSKNISELVANDKLKSFKLKYNLLSTEILLNQFVENIDADSIADNIKFLLKR